MPKNIIVYKLNVLDRKISEMRDKMTLVEDEEDRTHFNQLSKELEKLLNKRDDFEMTLKKKNACADDQLDMGLGIVVSKSSANPFLDSINIYESATACVQQRSKGGIRSSVAVSYRDAERICKNVEEYRQQRSKVARSSLESVQSHEVIPDRADKMPSELKASKEALESVQSLEKILDRKDEMISEFKAIQEESQEEQNGR